MFRLHAGQILFSASSTLVSLLIAFLIRSHRPLIESYSDRYIFEFEKAFKAIQYFHAQKTGKIAPDSAAKRNQAQKIRWSRCFFRPEPRPEFQGIFWQKVADSEFDTFLFSAYYDNRQIPWFIESKGITVYSPIISRLSNFDIFSKVKGKLILWRND